MKIQISANRVLPSGAFSIYESHTDNKTWVIPAWIEVPTGTKWSDIELIGRKLNVPSAIWKKHTVKGSKGKMYTVVIDEFNKSSCNCVGFGYHRKCKHIAQVTG
jgi:hypothetical protein